MFIQSAGACRRIPRTRARQLITGALAALPGTFALPLAAAQEAMPDTPVIKVLGHYDNSVGTSDAASQGTVTAGLIASRPALRPGELLEFVPGVIVTQHSGDGKANQYFLRGFNLDHGTDFATHVDGMPVNMRTHAHGQGYTDLNFLIPELVGRISYKKGPYYADEGDFASAGAARMELVDRLDTGMAGLTAGPNQYRRALVAGSTPQAGGSLLYALELAHNDGPWQVPEAFHKWSGVLRYSAASGADRFSVTAMGYRAGWRATSQIPLRAVQAGQLDEFGTQDASDAGHTARYSVSAQWKRRGIDTAWQASAYAVRSDLALYNNFTWFLDDPVAGDQFLQQERRTLTGFDASHTWFGQVGARTSTTTVGLQGRFDHIGPLLLAASADQRLLRTYARSRVDEASAALWLQNTLQWTPWLRSIAGLRHDRYRFDVASSVAASSGRAVDHVTSPKLSLVLGPWQATEFFINHGAGFHSNDARGTTAHLAPREGTPVEPVTPLVKTRGSEVGGVRSEIVPGLQSSLALWWLRSGSELVFSGDAGDTSASRASKRHGIEWNNHYIAAPWLLFDLDLAYSRARYLGDDPAGAHVPGAVEQVASFGATVNDAGPAGRWSGALQLRYFGPRPLVEDNSVRSSATALAYLRAGYRLDRGWQLSVDVFNLFDRRVNDIEYYYASRLPGEPARGVDDIHFHPGEPRTARVTLRLAF